ncbi:MAG TPA: hypothetical protein VHE13_11860 [Opitutus sp.]|nr:hypothetical protein [Opitutus sp.]
MKKFLPGFLVGLLAGGIAAAVLFHSHAAAPAGREPPAPPAEAAAPSDTVHLDADQLARAGIKVAAPAFESIAPAITAYGRALDPAPLVSAAADVATARAALDASAKELQRVESLHENGENASAQAVEAARGAAERDRVQLAAARAKLVATWGPQLSNRTDTAHFATELAGGWTLVRIDVSPDEAMSAPPASITVALLAGGTETFDAELLGPAPVADPQFQGRGYLAVVRGESLPVGAALRATLTGDGEPQRLPVLPRSAFVRHEGGVFVFTQTAAGTFARRPVALGRELADGTAVTSGVADNDQVVVVGAQQLLSTELGGGGED